MPRRPIYRFQNVDVRLTLTFTSPLLMDDLELLSRPASYVEFEVASTTSLEHEVQIYFDATAEWAVNDDEQLVEWKRLSVARAERPGDRHGRPERAGKEGGQRPDRLGLPAAGGAGRSIADGGRHRHAPRPLRRLGQGGRPGRRRRCRGRPTIIGRCCRWSWRWGRSAASRSAAPDRRLRRHLFDRIFWPQAAGLVAAAAER